jgi:hypothetical protein
MARITGKNTTSQRPPHPGTPDELPPPPVGWVDLVRPAGQPALEPTAHSEGLLAELWQHLPRGCRQIIREAYPRLYIQERRPEGPESGPTEEAYRVHPEEPVAGSLFLPIPRDDGSVAWRRRLGALLLHLLVDTVVQYVAPVSRGDDEGIRPLYEAVTDTLVTSWGLGEIWPITADILMSGEPVLLAYYQLVGVPSPLAKG